MNTNYYSLPSQYHSLFPFKFFFFFTEFCLSHRLVFHGSLVPWFINSKLLLYITLHGTVRANYFFLGYSVGFFTFFNHRLVQKFSLLFVKNLFAHTKLWFIYNNVCIFTWYCWWICAETIIIYIVYNRLKNNVFFVIAVFVRSFHNVDATKSINLKNKFTDSTNWNDKQLMQITLSTSKDVRLPSDRILILM